MVSKIHLTLSYDLKNSNVNSYPFLHKYWITSSCILCVLSNFVFIVGRTFTRIKCILFCYDWCTKRFQTTLNHFLIARRRSIAIIEIERNIFVRPRILILDSIHQEFPFYFLARDILFNRHIYFHNDSFRSDKNPMKFGLVLFFVSALSAYYIENSHKNS